MSLSILLNPKTFGATALVVALLLFLANMTAAAVFIAGLGVVGLGMGALPVMIFGAVVAGFGLLGLAF